MTVTLQPKVRKMYVFKVNLCQMQTVAEENLKFCVNYIVICAHFNKIYILAHTIINLSLQKYCKDKENWLLNFQEVP
jgi:hypothetical protein